VLHPAVVLVELLDHLDLRQRRLDRFDLGAAP
jgi:hypothetical protein